MVVLLFRVYLLWVNEMLGTEKKLDKSNVDSYLLYECCQMISWDCINTRINKK